MNFSSRIRMQDDQENPGTGLGGFLVCASVFLQDEYSLGYLQISDVWPRRPDRGRGDPAGIRSLAALESRISGLSVWIFFSFGNTLSRQEISMDTTTTSALFDDIALADRYAPLCNGRIGTRTPSGEAVLFDDIQALGPVAGMRPDADSHAVAVPAADSGSEPIDRDPQQSGGQERRRPCRAAARPGQGGNSIRGSRISARNLFATAKVVIDWRAIGCTPRAGPAPLQLVRPRSHAAHCRGPPARPRGPILDQAMHPWPLGAGTCWCVL